MCGDPFGDRVIIGEQTIAPAFGIELGAFACAPVRGDFDTQRVRIGFAQDLADVLALSPPRLVRRDFAPDTQAVAQALVHVEDRSAERLVGKGCVRTCRSWGWPY